MKRTLLTLFVALALAASFRGALGASDDPRPSRTPTATATETPEEWTPPEGGSFTGLQCRIQYTVINEPGVFIDGEESLRVFVRIQRSARVIYQGQTFENDTGEELFVVADSRLQVVDVSVVAVNGCRAVSPAGKQMFQEWSQKKAFRSSYVLYAVKGAFHKAWHVTKGGIEDWP